VLLLGALGLTQAGCLGEYLSMAMGADGRGLIAYQDTDRGVLKVAHCEDVACGTATLSVPDADGRWVGSYTSIARGADGLGLISYVEGTTNLRVAHCEDAACTRAGVSVLDTQHAASYTALAVGSDGLGLISFRNHYNGDLLVAHCEDMACRRATISRLDADAPSAGEYSAIAIGTDGLGLIAYHDRNRGWLKVAHCEDVACIRATIVILDDGHPQVPHVGGYVGARPSIVIGPDGLGLVSYQDQPVGNLKLAHCADTACSHADSIAIVDQGGIKGTGGGATSLAIAPGGPGLVAYHGSQRVNLLEQDLRLARCHEPYCRAASATTLDHRSSSDVGKYPALVIGPDGLGLVGYQDGGGGGFGPASVKVASCLDAACSRVVVSVIDQEP
jgi:hypothetical protein